LHIKSLLQWLLITKRSDKISGTPSEFHLYTNMNICTKFYAFVQSVTIKIQIY